MKNRFLKIIEEKGKSGLPYIPCMDQYVQSGLPPKYQNKHIIEMQNEVGSDMHRGVVAYKEIYDKTIVHQKLEKKGIVQENFSTPVGSIQQVSRFVPESPFIPFPTEYLIKTPEDFKIFRYVLEHTNIQPDYKDIEFFKSKYPDTILSASLSDSPYYDLLTKVVGIENFTYFYMENPEEIERTMDAMQENKKKHVELSAQSPADVLICYENTNTSNSLPDWIKQYGFRYLDEFADIAHEYDKPLLIHMCGKINLLLEDIAQCRFDGIIDVAPPPSGDCDFAKAIKIMENANKTIAGGIECNQYVMKDTKLFSASVEKFLENLPKSPFFMLGSGDAVPQGTPAENLIEAFRISGKYTAAV
jgi:uroporphyrinogen-III decarboxylase